MAGGAEMSEFIVRMELDLPDDLDADSFAELRQGEAVRARELADAGHLVRLWRSPGEQLANWGLWRARDQAELEAAIASLPLAPFARVVIHVTQVHPNDPAARE